MRIGVSLDQQLSFQKPEPVEAPPVPPVGGGSRMLRGLMLRDRSCIVACKQTKEKRIYFVVNVPPPKAFFSPKCTKYRLAAGLRPDPLGELTALSMPLDGFKGVLLKEWEGGVGKWGEGLVGREGRSGRERGICVIGLREMDTPWLWSQKPPKWCRAPEMTASL